MRLHPPTVHFPIAFWTVATMGDLSKYWVESIEKSVELAYLLGTTSALLAILSGLRDLAILPESIEADGISIKHLTWALTASTLYGIATLLLFFGPETEKVETLISAISVLGLGTLFFAGRTGGRLVHPS